jgi:uncharacterized membrane protein YbhN (UPF0104 family)
MAQDKELSIPNEKSVLGKLLWIGKLIVTILIGVYIYTTFQNEQKGVADIRAELDRIFSFQHAPVMLMMLVMVPVNWALESKKWQHLVRKVTPMSFWDAFRGTLTGLAIGVAAPAQLGDTLGRVAAIRSDKRLQAIGAAVVSNGIQFYVSVIAGAIAWYHLEGTLFMSEASKNLIGSALCIVIVLGWLVVIFRKPLLTWKSERAIFQKLHTYFKIIGTYSNRELMLATFFGVARYLVFLTQFMLALSLFNFKLSVPTLSACIALIFLAKTLIPAINVLGDLGLREFTALYVFKQYNLPAEEIITATFIIWIINVLGPILIGVFLIWKYKWKIRKND